VTRGPEPDDHFARIYAERADAYEAMTSREDYKGNLPATLAGICDTEGMDIVDLGSGTGRLAAMLAPKAHSVAAFDLSPAMLRVADCRLRAGGLENWRTAVADHRGIPLPGACADVVLSGWSLVYTVVWYPETWQQELYRALREIQRVLRPGGTVVVFETMGTGHETPNPPADLLPYFGALEDAGFLSTWFRTDFRFADEEEAKSITTFFFGDEIADAIQGDAPAILPECTGVWWRRY